MIICVSMPWGGLLYLLAGRDRQVQADQVTAGIPAGSVPRPRARVQVSPVEIKVDRLTKRFGSVLAVDDLSFAVRPGQVTGFLGPNGAGKPNLGNWQFFCPHAKTP